AESMNAVFPTGRLREAVHRVWLLTDPPSAMTIAAAPSPILTFAIVRPDRYRSQVRRIMAGGLTVESRFQEGAEATARNIAMPTRERSKILSQTSLGSFLDRRSRTTIQIPYTSGTAR